MSVPCKAKLLQPEISIILHQIHQLKSLQNVEGKPKRIQLSGKKMGKKRGVDEFSVNVLICWIKEELIFKSFRKKRAAEILIPDIPLADSLWHCCVWRDGIVWLGDDDIQCESMLPVHTRCLSVWMSSMVTGLLVSAPRASTHFHGN